MAKLLLEILLYYRQERKYLLHEFVLMPDHFHLLITPLETWERALQLVKGGFSYRAKGELGFIGAIWQPGYYDRRVRDMNECEAFKEYIKLNPVRKELVSGAKQYPYSSTGSGSLLDGLPQRLKPLTVSA